MKKEKLLFVMESLRIGGAERSLLTLLSSLNYERYDVELFLFRHNGELMEFLPPQVRLLPEDAKYHIFDQNRKMAPLRYLAQGDLFRAWNSLCYLFGCIRQKITRQPLYIGWNFVRHLFCNQELTADVAVAYMERKSVYFTAEYVVAPRKVAFIHNNYNIYPYDEKLDYRYFSNFQRIAAVAEYCRQVLVERFPMYADRFVVVKNLVSASMIRRMAQQPLPQQVEDNGKLVLVTVGRLVAQKGYDRAIRICKKLLEHNVPVKWYAIGDGSEYNELKAQIQSLGLKPTFILAGSCVNPYPWMKLADVYVQPSRFEGCSTTVAEAMILNKRIVCSDIPEFREQLQAYPNARFASNEDKFVQAICEIENQSVRSYPVAEEEPTAFYRCIET